MCCYFGHAFLQVIKCNNYIQIFSYLLERKEKNIKKKLFYEKFNLYLHTDREAYFMLIAHNRENHQEFTLIPFISTKKRMFFY